MLPPPRRIGRHYPTRSLAAQIATYAGVGAAAIKAGSVYYGSGGVKSAVTAAKVARAVYKASRKRKVYKKPAKRVDRVQNKRIRRLEKKVNQTLGKYIHRKREVCRLTTTAQQSSFNNCVAFGFSDLEDALSNLQYYDPATPGTLVTAAAASGTQHKDFLIDKILTRLRVHNNYVQKVRVSVYCFVPRTDTGISPATAFTNGLADVGNPSSTSPLVWPQDSPQLKDLWVMKYKKSRMMKPGDVMYCSHFIKGFEYDPSLYDNHTTSYNKNHGGHVWCVRLEGALGHDSSGNINNTNIAIDVEGLVETHITYPAGIDLKYIEVDDTADTLVGAANLGYRDTPDVLPYAAT